MNMPKQPVSVTLDRDNLLWLRGRAAARKRRSLSDALDEVVTAARLGAFGLTTPRSVAGTIDIGDDDMRLEHADTYIGSLFDAALGRTTIVRERERHAAPRPAALGAKRRPSAPRRKTGRA
jgi:hypothetical protein